MALKSKTAVMVEEAFIELRSWKPGARRWNMVTSGTFIRTIAPYFGNVVNCGGCTGNARASRYA